MHWKLILATSVEFSFFYFSFLGNQAERTVITLNKYNIEEPPEMTVKIQNYVSFLE